MIVQAGVYGNTAAYLDQQQMERLGKEIIRDGNDVTAEGDAGQFLGKSQIARVDDRECTPMSSSAMAMMR